MQGYNNCDHIYSFRNEHTSGCLWLGDFNSARNKRLHQQRSFQTVITAGLGMKVVVSDPVKHRLYPLYDSPTENIEKYFDQAFEHIEQGLQKGNVLVHCFAGVSRSSTIVISYLMKKLNWSYREALEHVRKQRWVVNPNPGFVRQLKRLETKLKKPINNPQVSFQKFEDKYFSRTLKYQPKLQANQAKGPKLFLSNYLTKSNMMRGNSVSDQKNKTRQNLFSLAKK